MPITGSVIPIRDTPLINPRQQSPNRKSKIKANVKEFHQTSSSPYTVYLNSLAPSGRKAMITLLSHSAILLGHDEDAVQFDWHQLTFENVYFIRTRMIDLGYSVNTLNMVLAALKGIAKTSFGLSQMSAENMQRIRSVKPVKGSNTRSGRRLSHQEVHALLSVCEGSPHLTKQ